MNIARIQAYSGRLVSKFIVLIYCIAVVIRLSGCAFQSQAQEDDGFIDMTEAKTDQLQVIKRFSIALLVGDIDTVKLIYYPRDVCIQLIDNDEVVRYLTKYNLNSVMNNEDVVEGYRYDDNDSKIVYVKLNSGKILKFTTYKKYADTQYIWVVSRVVLVSTGGSL